MSHAFWVIINLSVGSVGQEEGMSNWRRKECSGVVPQLGAIK